MYTTLMQPGMLGGTNWLYNPTYLNAGYTGTQGNDKVTFSHGDDGVVNTLGGHDTVTLNGGDSYIVELGAGNDRLHIRNDMDVFANGGSGWDKFYIHRPGDFTIDGGEDTDTVIFSNLDDGLWYLPMSIDVHYTGLNAATVHNVYSEDGFDMTATLLNVERIVGTGHADNAFGSDFDDWFDGAGGWDFFDGRDGDDTFLGRDGYDIADMGAGDDKAYGGDGQDTLSGGEGDDMLSGNAGADSLDGGTGDDSIWGGGASDIIRAGDGDDWVDAGQGNDHVQVYWGTEAATDGNDHFQGGGHLHNANGAAEWGDVLSFAGLDGGVEIKMAQERAWGRDASSAKMGVDTFEGFETYHGTGHADVYHSRDGDNASFFGFEGDDLVYAVLGDHHFVGGGGLDTVNYRGSEGALTINLGTQTALIKNAESGNLLSEHHIEGFEGVVGSTFGDVIVGDDLDNWIEGGEGADYLTGKDGADSFIFNGLGAHDYDRVVDFQSGEDKLVLDAMMTTGGQTITDFGVLDTNGDGALTNGEGGFFAWNDTGYLMAYNAIIEMTGITELQADDFLFL